MDDSELNLDGLDSSFPRQVALRLCQAIADNEPFLGKEGSGVEWNGAVRNANIMPPPRAGTRRQTARAAAAASAIHVEG